MICPYALIQLVLMKPRLESDGASDSGQEPWVIRMEIIEESRVVVVAPVV
jgi:hypothetical protein